MRLLFKRQVLPTIQRLRLEPGDILVAKFPERMTRQTAVELREQLTVRFNGVEVLVVAGDVEFSVITPPRLGEVPA